MVQEHEDCFTIAELKANIREPNLASRGKKVSRENPQDGCLQCPYTRLDTSRSFYRSQGEPIKKLAVPFKIECNEVNDILKRQEASNGAMTFAESINV